MKVTKIMTIGAILVGSAACATEDAGSASASDGVAPITCKKFAEDVVETFGEDDPAMLAIYQPKLIKDQIAAFNDGKLKIPSGKNEVAVLTCQGEASFSDGTDGLPIGYSMTVDSNDKIFFRWDAK